MFPLKLNEKANVLVQQILMDPNAYGVNTSSSKRGAVIIDAGVEVSGGFSVGRLITEICLGGYGHAEIIMQSYGSLELPTIHVYTDHPAIATLGSQLAGWHIKQGKYRAIASGPARALALKPKRLFSTLEYRDTSHLAVIVLETSKVPNEAVLEYIARECHVSEDKLSVLVAPTNCIAGLTQIAGRIVETAIHKLVELGFDPKKILYGMGSAPIAPFHPDVLMAMGRANDMLLYGGTVYLVVEHANKDELIDYVQRIPSIASKDYGRPFAEMFKAVEYDFYKLDPHLFAPAKIIINNQSTGDVFKAGSINLEIIKETISFTRV